MIEETSPARQVEAEPTLTRPKTSRGRLRDSPPLPPPRSTSIESTSTEEDRTTTPHTDLQFIRGTIDRVFDFHPESNSESSTFYEEISDDNNLVNADDDSVSSSQSAKALSKEQKQQPAVEAVQRFYQPSPPPAKVSPDSPKKQPSEHVTNLDEAAASRDSSMSNQLFARSHPANIRKKEPVKFKSTDNEQASSEVDDTLNDIEDDDSQDEKLKRQATIPSAHTSEENSPLHSANNPARQKKTSQETQTLQRVRD